MESNFVDRREGWTPQPRPEWVARLNEEGRILDIESIVPLDATSLMATARANTGLEDFGDDGWYDHFKALLEAIENEAKLNFMGRILTRLDFVQFLEIRLHVQHMFTLHPEISDEVINAPVMLLGHGRTGTTILQEVMSCDPQFRVVKRWEALFPYPPPEERTYDSDPRIVKAHNQITIFDRITPEWKTMHKVGGDLPVECAEYIYSCFLSNVFTSAYQIPSYAKYLETQDTLYTIRWHKKILQFLQFKYKKEHWLLKNPIWIDMIPEVLTVYPDAKIVLTHRDPIVVADSVVNVLGTIFWWRTDEPWSGMMMDEIISPTNRAKSQANLMRWMDDGLFKPGNISNVLYQDFVSNPESTLQALYDDLDLTLTPQALKAMTDYMLERKQTKYGKYNYTNIEKSAIERERILFRPYQQYFKIEDEI
jgi:hypothetical protein